MGERVYLHFPDAPQKWAYRERKLLSRKPHPAPICWNAGLNPENGGRRAERKKCRRSDRCGRGWRGETKLSMTNIQTGLRITF